jgi:hypothetical protein
MCVFIYTNISRGNPTRLKHHLMVWQILFWYIILTRYNLGGYHNARAPPALPDDCRSLLDVLLWLLSRMLLFFGSSFRFAQANYDTLGVAYADTARVLRDFW